MTVGAIIPFPGRGIPFHIGILAIVIVFSIPLAAVMSHTTVMATNTYVLFNAPKQDAPKLTVADYDPEMQAYRDNVVRKGADGEKWNAEAERLANCPKAINDARSVGPSERIGARWRYARANIEGVDPTFKAAAESFRKELQEKLQAEHHAQLDRQWAVDLRQFGIRFEAIAAKMRVDLGTLRSRWECTVSECGGNRELALNRLEDEAEELRRARGDEVLSISGIGASEIGVRGVLNAEILSVTGPLTLPAEIHAECGKCETDATVEPEPADLLENGVQGIRGAVRLAGECGIREAGCKCDNPGLVLKVTRLADYSVLVLGDPPSLTPGINFDDTRLTAHLVGPKPPASGGARFTVVPFANQQNRRIDLVATSSVGSDIRPTPPKLTPELRARIEREIAGIPRSELIKQVGPDVVGRELAQEAVVHALASVGKIPDISGKVIRGVVYVVLLGDSTVGKTALASDTAQDQGLGPFIQAENAKRTGILYAIEKGATGAFTLTWGLLPRANGGYAVIDGLEAWPSEAQGDVRSALRDQFVSVDKVVKGKRPTVVRITITANPEHNIAEYAFRVEAIRDTIPFRRGPDIARLDLWVVFGQADVGKGIIAQRAEARRPVDPALFRQFLGWVWSRTPANVVYLPAARARIRELSEMFMSTLGSADVPLVSDGFRDTLCRVSVSEAALAFSTTNGEDLIVGLEHVDAAARFLLSTYEACDLPGYVAHHRTDVGVTGGDALLIARSIGESGDRIIDRLSRGPATAREMSPVLNLSEEQIRHAYTNLGSTGFKLIETRPSVGAELTPRGVAYFRWLRELQIHGLETGAGGSYPKPVLLAGLREKLGLLAGNGESKASEGEGSVSPRISLPKATERRTLDGEASYDTPANLSPDSATSPHLLAGNREKSGSSEVAVSVGFSEDSTDEKKSVQAPLAVDSKAPSKDPPEAES